MNNKRKQCNNCPYMLEYEYFGYGLSRIVCTKYKDNKGNFREIFKMANIDQNVPRPDFCRIDD